VGKVRSCGWEEVPKVAEFGAEVWLGIKLLDFRVRRIEKLMK
jgi:hypothetical protein